MWRLHSSERPQGEGLSFGLSSGVFHFWWFYFLSNGPRFSSECGRRCKSWMWGFAVGSLIDGWKLGSGCVVILDGGPHYFVKKNLGNVYLALCFRALSLLVYIPSAYLGFLSSFDGVPVGSPWQGCWGLHLRLLLNNSFLIEDTLHTLHLRIYAAVTSRRSGNLSSPHSLTPPPISFCKHTILSLWYLSGVLSSALW